LEVKITEAQQTEHKMVTSPSTRSIKSAGSAVGARKLLY